MKIENLCARRLIGDVSGATTYGHKMAIKGGYIHQTFQGGYTLTPLGWGVVRKIENIIRDEMNKIDGQELLLPVVCTADLWKETNRYDSMDNIAKFKSRTGRLLKNFNLKNKMGITYSSLKCPVSFKRRKFLDLITGIYQPPTTIVLKWRC